jgi:hypothetical protein
MVLQVPTLTALVATEGDTVITNVSCSCKQQEYKEQKESKNR